MHLAGQGRDYFAFWEFGFCPTTLMMTTICFFQPLKPGLVRRTWTIIILVALTRNFLLVNAATYVRVSSGSCSDVPGRSNIATASECSTGARALGRRDTTPYIVNYLFRPPACSTASNDWLQFGPATSTIACGTHNGGYTYDCICKVGSLVCCLR